MRRVLDDGRHLTAVRRAAARPLHRWPHARVAARDGSYRRCEVDAHRRQVRPRRKRRRERQTGWVGLTRALQVAHRHGPAQLDLGTQPMLRHRALHHTVEKRHLYRLPLQVRARRQHQRRADERIDLQRQRPRRHSHQRAVRRRTRRRRRLQLRCVREPTTPHEHLEQQHDA